MSVKAKFILLLLVLGGLYVVFANGNGEPVEVTVEAER